MKNYIKNLGVSLEHEFVFVTRDFSGNKIAKVYDSKRVIVNAFVDYHNNSDSEDMKEFIKGYDFLRIITAHSPTITLYNYMFTVVVNKENDNIVIHIKERL